MRAVFKWELNRGKDRKVPGSTQTPKKSLNAIYMCAVEESDLGNPGVEAGF